MRCLSCTQPSINACGTDSLSPSGYTCVEESQQSIRSILTLSCKQQEPPAPPLALAHTRASFLRRLFKHGPRALLTLLFDHWTAHAASSWLQELQVDVDSVKQYFPHLTHYLSGDDVVGELLTIHDEKPSWWLQQVVRAEKVFQQDLQSWIDNPSKRVSFPLRKHLHAHLARAHRIYSPSRHYTVSPACLACLRWYGSVKQSQQHLKCSSKRLLRVVHLIPPLT